MKVNSFKPISILNAVKFLRSTYSISFLLKLNHKLNSRQHVYRKNHSCHSALSIFSQSIYDSKDKPKNKVVAISFDLRAAFDAANHDILISKLMNNPCSNTSSQVRTWDWFSWMFKHPWDIELSPFINP